jgi:hypothetical protein
VTPDPDDDDAFTWEGDEHPTRASLHRPTEQPEQPASPQSETEVESSVSYAAQESVEPLAEKGPDAATESTPDAADDEPEREPMGNVALVTSGLLGGIYLLYVIGWIIGGLRVSKVADALVAVGGQAPIMWSSGNVVGVWLAALAPVLWFVTVWIVTRRSRAWVRWVWLIAGAVLLVPWPLTMLGVQL